jgi:hypothetical protein
MFRGASVLRNAKNSTATAAKPAILSRRCNLRIRDLPGITEALHRSLAVVQSQRCLDQRYRNRRDWIRELCVPQDLQYTRSLPECALRWTGQ